MFARCGTAFPHQHGSALGIPFPLTEGLLVATALILAWMVAIVAYHHVLGWRCRRRQTLQAQEINRLRQAAIDEFRATEGTRYAGSDGPA